MKWVVYILECSDSSLYTGMTNDLERRLDAHRSGRGANYTKHRSPLRVRYVEYRRTKSDIPIRSQIETYYWLKRRLDTQLGLSQ